MASQPRQVGLRHVAALCFVSILVGIAFTILYIHHVAQDQAAADRANKAAVAAQQKKSLDQFCHIITKMEDAYHALESPNADSVAATWQEIGQFMHCP